MYVCIAPFQRSKFGILMYMCCLEYTLFMFYSNTHIVTMCNKNNNVTFKHIFFFRLLFFLTIFMNRNNSKKKKHVLRFTSVYLLTFALKSLLAKTPEKLNKNYIYKLYCSVVSLNYIENCAIIVNNNTEIP
jgi:hypothetical protein